MNPLIEPTAADRPAPPAVRAPASSDRHAAYLVLLVTAAVFINYIDRGNLSTAAPLMQDELKLSAARLGFLFTAFYIGYVPCMPATGFLAERFGAKRIFAAGVALWSLATFATGFATGFTTLLGLRVLLGIGESVAFPCVSKVLAQNVPPDRLGVANGIMSFGYLLGPAVGTLLGGALMVWVGWRPVFIVFGALSLVWLWPWLRTRSGDERGPATAQDPAGSAATPGLAQILRQRALWGASLGHFAANYGYYFIISWLPFYLVKARGFSLATMTAMVSWAYLLNALSALAMGWFTDRWIRSGRGATSIYKTTMGVTHVAGVACMCAMVLLPATGSVVALFAFLLISGCSYPGLFAIPQILAGPRAAGRWVGIQNAAGNAAGLIAPAITGILVDETGGFGFAFALAAAVNVLGLIGWVLVLPRIAPLAWDAPSPARIEAT